MKTPFWDLAENILTHLECIPGCEKQTHTLRLEQIELIRSIVEETLTAEGYIRILKPSGKPLNESG